jgi:hypothetical protein
MVDKTQKPVEAASKGDRKYKHNYMENRVRL